MKPKNFFLLTLFVSLKTCNGGPCQPFYEDCSTNPAQCTITCTDKTDPTTCGTVGDSDKCPADVKTNPMNKENCKASCVVADISCYYYRFEERAGMQYCYLLGEKECQDWGVPTCEPPFCESGKAGDNTCDEGDNGIPVPDFTCPGGTPAHTPGLMPDFKLHWSCNSLSSGSVNIEDTTVPGDTICKAYPECNGELVPYECESNMQPIPKGEWIYKGAGTDPNFLEENASGEKRLTDPICNADDLTLTDYENQVAKGMEILCVEADVASDGTVGTVAAQNSCLLICDGYPILNFYTDKQLWKYKLMEGAETDLTLSSADDVIYCHKAEGSGAEDQDV